MTSVAPPADTASTRPIGATGGLSTLLAWLAIVGSAAFIVFFGGSLPFLHIPAARITVQLIALAAAVVSIGLVWAGRIDPRTPLRAPVIACVGVMLASTIVSAQPSVSRESLGLLLIAAPLYPLIRAATWSRAFGVRLENLAAIAAVGLVVAYAIQVGLLWVQWWADVGPSIPPLRPANASLTTGGVNSVATYIELLVLPAIWIVRQRVGAAAAVALAAAGALEVVVTGSRGAWLGLTAAGAFLVILHWAGIREVIRERFEARRGLLTIAAIAGAIAVVAVAVVALPRLATGDAGRIELWQAALRIGLANPILGAGPGTWQDLRTFEPISDARTAALFTPHNGVLQVFAETGIAGLVVTGWLVVTIARVGLRSVRSAPTAGDRAFRELTLASLVAVGVHSIVDPLFGVPAVALLVLFAIARLDPAPGGPEEGVPTPVRRWRAIEAAIATVVAVALLLPADLAMLRAASGNSALDRADWTAAASEFDAAVGLDDRPVYRLGQALAAAGGGDPSQVRASFEAAAQTNALTFMSAGSATVADGAGDQPEALENARDVDARGPYDPTATVNAAIIEYDAGQTDQARTGLAAAMTAVPSLTYSTRPAGLFDEATWEQARVSALGAIRAADPAMFAYCLIRAASPAADIDAALAALPDGPERRILALLAAAEAGGKPDLDAARAIVRQAPTSLIVLMAHERLARLGGSQSDLDLAYRLSNVTFYDVPPLDEELVTDGSPTADYSLRIFNYPYAMLRPGPRRPYPVGMVTIEPVLRDH